jgi:hypothetical protein
MDSYCNGMRALGEKLMPDLRLDAEERSDQALKVVKPNEMVFLGVIAEEPLVCYGAILQKVKLLSDDDHPQVAVVAATILREKVVLSYLFAPYVDRSTVTQVLTRQRSNLAQLHKANRN